MSIGILFPIAGILRCDTAATTAVVAVSAIRTIFPWISDSARKTASGEPCGIMRCRIPGFAMQVCVGVIIGEFLAARKGLGYLIIYGSQVFQMHMVITSIILLCIIAMGLYQITGL